MSVHTARKHDTCPRCLTTPRTTPKGEHCPQCGLVLEDQPIDHSEPWRDFGDGENPEHAHPSNPNSSRALGTQTPNLDNGRQQHLQGRLNAGTRKERARNYGTSEVHRISANTGLPTPLIDRAKYLFRQLHSSGYDISDLDEVTAGCVWVSCRENQSGRTAGDIEPASRTSERMIHRRGLTVAGELGVLLPPPSVVARTRVVASRLHTPNDSLSEALELVRGHEGREAPSTIAAAAIYECTEFTQGRVAGVAGCNEKSLRVAWKDLVS